MADQSHKFEFKEEPKELIYLKKPPLKLHQELFFFHSKSRFRKDLNKLQYLFKEHVGVALHAPGIRDTYLREEFTKTYYIILLTTNEIMRNTDKIIEDRSNISIEKGCYYMDVETDYFLVLAKDYDGIRAGIDTMETILQQTFEDFFKTKNFEDYIYIPTLSLKHCKAL